MPRPSTVIASISAALLSGCVGTNHLQPLPVDWGMRRPASVGNCPDLQGKYPTRGSESGLENICRNGVSEAGNWNCSLRLDDQLQFAHPSEAIQISQDGGDSVTFSGVSADGTLVKKQFTRKAGDFSCDSRGLTFKSTSSIWKDENQPQDSGETALVNAGAMLLMRTGLRTLEKTYYVSDSGHLILKTTITNVGVYAPFPYRASFSAWFRWAKADDDSP